MICSYISISRKFRRGDLFPLLTSLSLLRLTLLYKYFSPLQATRSKNSPAPWPVILVVKVLLSRWTSVWAQKFMDYAWTLPTFRKTP